MNWALHVPLTSVESAVADTDSIRRAGVEASMNRHAKPSAGRSNLYSKSKYTNWARYDPQQFELNTLDRVRPATTYKLPGGSQIPLLVLPLHHQFLRSFDGESRRMNPYEPPAGTIDETDETVTVTPLLTNRPAAKPLRSFVIAVFGALLAAGPYFGIAPVRTILCAGAFGMAVVWLERIFRYKS